MDVRHLIGAAVENHAPCRRAEALRYGGQEWVRRIARQGIAIAGDRFLDHRPELSGRTVRAHEKLPRVLATLHGITLGRVHQSWVVIDVARQCFVERRDARQIARRLRTNLTKEAIEAEQVALALYEQYMPRFAGDDLPSTGISSAVAMADKLDTIVGIFGIGQAPKGSDPFALRRASLGVLRIIVENGYNLDLTDLIAKAKELLGDKLTNDNVEADVIDFMLGRFRAWYQDAGFSVDIIQAVLANRPTKPTDFDQRVKAVSHFRELEAAEALAAANKRVGNILAKFDGELAADIDLALLQEDAEKALAENVAVMTEALEPAFATGNYQEALSKLAALREPVDAFFDNVMVMADDEALKKNRLTLLNNLRNLFLQIADISLLQK